MARVSLVDLPKAIEAASQKPGGIQRSECGCTWVRVEGWGDIRIVGCIKHHGMPVRNG